MEQQSELLYTEASQGITYFSKNQGYSQTRSQS